MKRFIALLCAFLPGRAKRFVLNRLLGHRIHPSARIGFALLLADHIEMEEGSEIGNFVVCKNLNELKLGAHAIIGRLIWIYAIPPSDRRFFRHQPERRSGLVMGEHSAITARHIIDCTNHVTIGKYSTIAGYHTQILTHSIDLKESRQDSHPVEVGDYCFVGTGSVILGGSRLPSYSVLGAKSLLNKSFSEEWQLYGGVPAKPVTALPRDMKYFSRERGVVN